MRPVSTKAILATAALSALLAGCATTVEMGPGYYHYDSRIANRTTTPTAVYQEPTVVYRQPTVVYREPAAAYQEQAPGYYYHDHGQ